MTRNFRYFLSFTFMFFLIFIPLLPVLFSEEEEPEVSGEFRAVLIGIDKYQPQSGDKEYANLNYCVKDIEAIADILKKNGYKDENITVVKEVKADGESFPATKSRIEGKIKEVIADCKMNDVILVYFSGHGIRLKEDEGWRNYLVPYDGKYIPGKGSAEELTREELTSRKETLLTVSSIEDLLKNNCDARTKYFIMDACQKDVLANVERGEAKVKSDFHLEPRDIKKGLIKITSCSAGETSRENPEKGHGLFSYALIEGINDKADKDQNGQITITELFDYVSKQVPEYAREMKSEQTPLLLMEEVEGEIVFAYNPAKMKANALKQESQKLLSESRKETLSEKEKESQLETALEKLTEAQAIWPGGEYGYLEKEIKDELAGLTGVRVQKLTDEAWEYYDRKDFESSLEKCQAVLKLSPANASIQRLQKQIERDTTPDPKQEAQKLAGEALQLYQSKDYKEALAKINEALEQDTENISNKGIKELIVKAIEEQKSDPKQEAQKLAGEAYTLYESGSYKEALAKINEALEQDTENISNKAIKKLIETALVPKASPSSESSSTTVSPSEMVEGLSAGTKKTIRIKGIDYTFCWCPAGTFEMGSPESEEERFKNETQHTVTLSEGFWLLEHEVTLEMFRSFMESSSYKMGDGYEGKGGWGYNAEKDKYEQDPKYTWENPGFSQDDDHPVTNVDWAGAKAFCKWLSQESGEKIDLPSEAEWEYACRAGTTSPFNFGGVLNGKQANCKGNYPYGTDEKGQYLKKTTRVKSYSPNAWGLYDMHGNVYEWCNDWYDSDYYTNSPSTDPTGPDSGSIRVIRGGSWVSNAQDCRSANRNWLDPAHRYYILGFRLALSSTH